LKYADGRIPRRRDIPRPPIGHLRYTFFTLLERLSLTNIKILDVNRPSISNLLVRLRPVAFITLFLTIWQFAISRHPVHLLPTPEEVVGGIGDLVQHGLLLKYVVASLFRVTWGYVLAVVLAIPLGLAIGWSRRAEMAFNPLIQILRPISPLAWIPIAILWFGVGDLAAIFDWAAIHGERERDYAVVGIRHPLALAARPIDVRPRGAYSLRGHSIGGFGSVTTNKLIATIVGEVFDKFVQAYPRYGSEKKGLPTTYYLTIADEPIHTHAELERVDLVPLHDVAAFGLGNPLAGLVDGGTLFLQSELTDPGAIWATIPTTPRAEIIRRRIRVTALDTAALARARSPRPDLVLRMQGIALVGVFLRVSPFAAEAGLDRQALLAAVGERLGRFFGKRGRAVIEANLELVAAAYDGLIDVSAELGLPAGIERGVTVIREESSSLIGAPS